MISAAGRAIAGRLCTVCFLILFLPGCEGGSHSELPPGESALPAVASGEAERCYEREDLRPAAAMAVPELSREVLILIDQTTQFPDDVRRSAVDQVAALADPGTRLSIGTFSAYTESAHSRVIYESVIEPAFPREQRDDAPMRALRAMDQCLEDRRLEETERLRAALERAFSESQPTMRRSDILANIRGFGGRMGESPADDKIFVLLSDMLENSSAISFYANGAMRRIVARSELDKAERAELFADLAGAKVYLIGAGLVPPEVQSYRSLEEMGALEAFWRGYFERSGAGALEVGKPTLLRPIG